MLCDFQLLLLSQRCITFHCDNANVVHAINSQSSHLPKLMSLVRKLVVACLKHNILFTGVQKVIPALLFFRLSVQSS